MGEHGREFMQRQLGSEQYLSLYLGGGQCVRCGRGRVCVSEGGVEGALSVPVPDPVPEENQVEFRIPKKIK